MEVIHSSRMKNIRITRVKYFFICLNISVRALHQGLNERKTLIASIQSISLNHFTFASLQNHSCIHFDGLLLLSRYSAPLPPPDIPQTHGVQTCYPTYPIYPMMEFLTMTYLSFCFCLCVEALERNNSCPF